MIALNQEMCGALLAAAYQKQRRMSQEAQDIIKTAQASGAQDDD